MGRKVTTVPITDAEVSGGMAYYKNLNIAHDLTLPLRASSIRFGVLRRNGLSSNAWRCWSEKAGDIYITCRDHMNELKISLHQSGRH